MEVSRSESQPTPDSQPNNLPPAGPIVNANRKIFRPGTQLESRPINFIVHNGGIGDYINFCAALKWVQKENPHVIGRIWVSPPFKEVMEYLFAGDKRWSVHDRKLFEKEYEANTLIASPNRGQQLINPTGAHLMDLGWFYYAQTAAIPPEYNYLPEIDYVSGKDWALPEQYAIFTPGATAMNRVFPPKAFNELVKYTASLGITPVFLGKRDINEIYKANFHEEYDLSLGLDLREQTTLLEAIEIMRDAKFVIGIDNGLLHLAGTTSVPIIFGHNISPVEHRRIRRRNGLTVDISLTEKQLQCIGCQAKMRFVYRQRFSRCIYGDNLCVDLLFKNLEVWRQGIRQCLNQSNKPKWWRK